MITIFFIFKTQKMKSFKMFFLGIALAGAMAACGGNSHNHEGHEQEGAATEETTEAAKPDAEKQGKEYTSAYVCPMHCEGSGSDQAGTCPVCGMDYVAQADLKDGHSHE